HTFFCIFVVSMKIAVYSGSFNPLHKGHLAIMKHLTEEAGFDRVYLVVTPQNPFKDAHSLPTGKARFDAAVEAVAKYPELKVNVLDIELKMTPPQYTIRTLDTLREMEPENEFTLVIGADNLANFQGWREHSRILREYGVVVFPRKGFHRGHAKARLMKEDPSFRIGLLKAPLVTISSTEIRHGGKQMDHWLM
ncbi:MAG: nicotinate (nicotinamide) nucleotide adenylyltransferase, partial [Bacteroidales bacterium]|nr:nicotinate (nicotinamide) nucleotide adenylyltransferase [Bacteroidales bacterium]